MSNYPYELDKNYAIDAIKNGYNIGVEFDTHYSVSKPYNWIDADKALFITDWLLHHTSIIGPFPAECAKWWNIDTVPPFAVDQKDKFRPITDFSYPKDGTSLNDNLFKDLCTVTYVRFEEVVDLIHSLGKDAFIWVIDLKDAYYRVPVRPQDWRKLGIYWCGFIFIMCCLPMGLSSSPRLFTHFADLVEWILVSNNKDIFLLNHYYINKIQKTIRHYLDDFFGGALDKITAIKQFNALRHILNILGIPTTDKKCSWPHTRQKILGFIYDTITQMVYIPQDKVIYITKILKYYIYTKNVTITKQQLESVIGILRWMCVCFRCGEYFVRRLEAINNKLKKKYHTTRVTLAMKLDFIWWLKAIKKGLNGIKFIDILRKKKTPDFIIHTDAAGSKSKKVLGFGGWNNDGHYFQCKWNNIILKNLLWPLGDIQFEELFALTVATKLWCHKWTNCHILFYIDNQPVENDILNHRAHLKRNDKMTLLRILATLSLKYNFTFDVKGIRSKDNHIADKLSRFEDNAFEFWPYANNKADKCHQAVQWVVNEANKEKQLQFADLPF